MRAQQNFPLSSRPQRHMQIDAFRAFALFGLLLVHCVELFELHWADPKPSLFFDKTFLVFAGKAFAMFALSFGLSFSIIIKRAAERQEPFELRYFWRSIILVFFGLAHTVIYRGDILVVLGLVGLMLIPLNRLKSNLLLSILAALFLVNLPLVLRLLMTYEGVSTGIPVFVEANSLSMQAYLNGGVLESLRANLGSGNLVKWLFMLESGRVSQMFGLFLLGLILGRLSFFTDLTRFQIHRWTIGLSTACLGWLLHDNQTQIMALFPVSNIGETQFFISNLVKGWINLLVMVAQTLLFFELWFLLKGRGLHYLAPMGRISLTLYICQSLFFIPLLYNMGLGLYDDVTAKQMFWVGIGSFVLQGFFASFWVRYYHYGPLEWLWRAATNVTFKVPFRRV